MKKILLTSFVLLFFICAFSQSLVNSRTFSYYTFIYKISNAEAEELYKNADQPIEQKNFHTLYDFYPSDSIFKKQLPVGHYLFIKSIEDKLDGELMSVNNLDMHILTNNRDLMLRFTNKRGEEIKSLKPTVKNKPIHFNKQLNVYRIAKTNKHGFVYVEHEGHVNFFKIKRRYNNTLPARVKRRVLGTFPINILISPITYTVRSVKSLIQYQYIRPPGIYYRVRRLFEGDYNTKTYQGYMVLNKPMYKPNDTIKIKAFFTNKKGKPVTKKLSLYLSSYSARMNKKLGTATPYSKGAYVFEFVLHDSLNLKLDREYSLYFEDKRENDYPDARFLLEHYELKQNFFSLTPAPLNQAQKPATILLKGTDSNDLPLYDVKANLVVKTKKVNDFFEKEVFVPDLLWTHNLTLEPLGDTKLTLPDSIYPKASIEYDIAATFTNADHEQQAKSISVSYNPTEAAAFTLKNDSIAFPLLQGSDYRLAVVANYKDTLSINSVTLPLQEKIHPMAARYLLLDEKNLIAEFSLRNESDKIEVLSERTKDSLHIVIQNPRKLIFLYQLFKNNTIIEQGSAEAYRTTLKTNPNNRYYLALQYLWGGQAEHQNYDLTFAKKILAISVDHPSTVFPGQTVTVALDVKDALGKPVQHADLTAYATTKKFRNQSRATVPNFEQFKSRKAFNEFSKLEVDKVEISQKLQYDFWKKRLGLDSLAYYQFLYPEKGIYTHYTYAEDSITQLAPFIMKDGEPQAIHYIYFNKELKYYYGVENIQPYSFSVRDAVNDISIRLRDRLVVIKNVRIENGRKLILSLDLNNLPDSVHSTEQPVTFTQQEIQKLRPHFLWVKRDFGQSKAHFKQGNSFYVLKPYQARTSQMVGPFFPGPINYHSTFDISFYFKPQMVYTFESNLIDRETYYHGLNQYLPSSRHKPALSDQVLTEKRVQEYWKEAELKTTIRFRKYPDSNPIGSEFGRLYLRDKNLYKKPAVQLATFIINLDNPDEFYIFPSSYKDLSPLLPGLYQCVVIYNDEQYSKPKPIRIKANGHTLYDITDEPLLAPDSFSKEVMEKIKKWSQESYYVDQTRQKEMQNIRQLYYTESATSNLNVGGRWVTGTITSHEDGSPLPGVNVIVKGTSIGTVTDVDGFYRIYVPYNAQLVISFIGLQSQEIETGSRSQADVQMQMDVTQLSEVIVVGYGVESSRKALGYAVSNVEGALSGKIAGVQISGAPGAADSISIKVRGAASLSGSGSPLVIIDGVLKRLEDIEQSKIISIEILKSAQAVALYGSRAANGVVLISTKPGTTRTQLLQTKLPEIPQLIALNENAPGNSLRKNFRDYAFWQPKLRTNKEGIATFTATYPDDITGWNIHVLGMASKKRTGEVRTHVQSFKPLVAQLMLPQFLVAGDSTRAIGKITNYTADSLMLSKTFTLNQNVVSENKGFIKNSLIDSVQFVAAGDSVAVQYEIEYNRYRDGELRKIPVLPIGSKESTGIFAALAKDTTFTLHFNKQSRVTFYAQADVLDVLLHEIEGVKVYPYDCNEQLASKLKALLAERAIREYKKEKFTHHKQIEKIIKKLLANQAIDGSWSWWGMKGGSMWITLHVAEAFAWAEKFNYSISFDRTKLNSFLKNPTVPLSAEEQLKSWIYLTKAGERVITKSLVDTLARNNKLYNNYYKLLAMRLLQLSGEELDWKWIESQKHQTLKGNLYWGEEKQTLWNNDIDNSLLVYQLFEHKNPEHANLLLIRNYFIEKRKQSWRNTYESACIIETLLPLLQRSTKHSNSVLTLSGDHTLKTDKFPLEKTLLNLEQVTITKTGTDPVYFTAYEEKWNPSPKKVENDFIIQTEWSGKTAILKAGKPIELKVKLHVKKDADFVMISVPIPAGCSYESKNQSWSNGEVQREYDVHETRIYCERLRAGTYEYSIKLIPRYKGKYSLNPAKIEWMYFPVIFGRDEIKTVVIK